MKEYIHILLLMVNNVLYGWCAPVFLAVLISCFQPQQGTEGANQPAQLDVFFLVFLLFLGYTVVYYIVNRYIVRQYPKNTKVFTFLCLAITLSAMAFFLFLKV